MTSDVINDGNHRCCLAGYKPAMVFVAICLRQPVVASSWIIATWPIEPDSTTAVACMSKLWPWHRVHGLYVDTGLARQLSIKLSSYCDVKHICDDPTVF